MTIAVTGSIATDHLMRFPGKFSEQLLAELEARLSSAGFAAAQARGRAPELGAAVAELLAEAAV